MQLEQSRPINQIDGASSLGLHEVDHVGLSCERAKPVSERPGRERSERVHETIQAHAAHAAAREGDGLDLQPGGWEEVERLVEWAQHPAIGSQRSKALEQGDGAPRGPTALEQRRAIHHDQGTQGCESMTHMVAGAKELAQELFGRGAAGDAGAARGRQIASNIIVQFGARGIVMALGIVTVSLLARTLQPTGYGVWNGASSYVALFAVVTDLGFTIAATQRMAAEPEREPEWLGALVVVRLLASGVVFLVCVGCIPLLLSDSHDTRLVALILSLSTLWTGTTAALTVFQTRLRGGLVLSFTVLQGLVWLSAVAALHVTNASTVGFAIANTAVIAFVSAVQLGFTRRYATIAWRAGLALVRPLVRRAIPLGLASVLITIYFQVDSVLLLGIAGAREAGIYGAAYGFLGPLTFIPAAVMASFFPVLSAVLVSEPERARRLVQVCADLMGVVGLPILAGAIALSDPLVHLIFGPSFARAAGLLPILMVAFVSICFGSLAGFLAPLLELQWRLALYSAIGAIANVVLNLILIPSHGAYGSAWATVATEVLTMVLMLSTSLRALNMTLSPRTFLRTAALATAMTGLMVATRTLGLVPAAVLGVALYAVGLIALGIVDPRELRAARTVG